MTTQRPSQSSSIGVLICLALAGCGGKAPGTDASTEPVTQPRKAPSKLASYEFQLFGGGHTVSNDYTLSWQVEPDSPVGQRTHKLFALLCNDKERVPAAVDTKKYKIAPEGHIWAREKVDGEMRVTNWIRFYFFDHYTIEMPDAGFKLDDADQKAVDDYLQFVYQEYEKTKPRKPK